MINVSVANLRYIKSFKSKQLGYDFLSRCQMDYREYFRNLEIFENLYQMAVFRTERFLQPMWRQTDVSNAVYNTKINHILVHKLYVEIY